MPSRVKKPAGANEYAGRLVRIVPFADWLVVNMLAPFEDAFGRVISLGAIK
jgi:hypothetical protein